MNDMLEAIRLVYSNNPNWFNTFSSVSPFTTENIKGYFPNLENKEVLTVTGSGDHYLNSILLGAKNVTCFDINKLSLHYLKLKIASIKTLELDEFKQYFSIIETDKPFDYEMFKKIEKSLDDSTIQYWKYIYNFFYNNGKSILESKIFLGNPKDNQKNSKLNFYLEENNYYKLRNKLKNEIDFILSDINNLQLKQNYDIMFFSNINEYQNNLKEYLKLIYKLSDKLNQYGNIYFAYLYSYQKNKQNQELKQMIECNSKIFEGYYSITKEVQDKDKVLIYSK